MDNSDAKKSAAVGPAFRARFIPSPPNLSGRPKTHSPISLRGESNGYRATMSVAEKRFSTWNAVSHGWNSQMSSYS